MTLEDGLRVTYGWIKEKLEEEVKSGLDKATLSSSTIVTCQAPVALGELRKADGKEGF